MYKEIFKYMLNLERNFNILMNHMTKGRNTANESGGLGVVVVVHDRSSAITLIIT